MSNNGQKEFEREIHILQAETANLFRHIEVDAPIRALYADTIAKFAAQYRMDATMGKISWEEAAREASKVRNAIMDELRLKSTPVGRAIAEQMKKKGASFETMIGRKTAQSMGIAEFDKLSIAKQSEVMTHFKNMGQAEKNSVYAAIVKSSGKSKPSTTLAMRLAKPAGRALIFMSIAMSVYTVATAEDKLDAVGEESAITLAGIGGGMAGGAAMGIWFGPVGVTIGAFVGGAAAAFAVDFAW